MQDISFEHVIRTLANEAAEHATKAIAAHGITLFQYDIMEAISRYMDAPENYALLPKRIAAMIHHTSNSTGDNIRDLIAREYIRVAIGGSRLLTSKGVLLLEECRASLQPVNKRMQRYFEDIGIGFLVEAFLMQQRMEKE